MIDDFKLIGITELADEVGMERGRAARILRTSGLARDKYKRWPRQAALDALRPHIDVAQQAAQHALGLGAHVAPAGDYAAARSLTEATRAEKMRQEIDIRAGKLVERSTVIEAGEEFAVTIRNAFLGVPAKVAPRLVGKTREQIVIALDVEIRHALHDLADINGYLLGGAV